jgi:hypothetical protein
VEEVSGGDGVAAGVGDIARAQLRHGEISQREDAGTAGGRGQLIERGGECGLGGTVVDGLEVNVAGAPPRLPRQQASRAWLWYDLGRRYGAAAARCRLNVRPPSPGRVGQLPINGQGWV